MNSVYSMIVTTCADMENAKEIAKDLETNHLAACVQMLPYTGCSNYIVSE